MTFQDQAAIKKSKRSDGLTDLVFHCKDGSVAAHQLLLAPHSSFLKRLFLAQHSFEFSLIDWDKGLAQLTGRRASDQPIEIILPDYSRTELKRTLDIFYKGIMYIEEIEQSQAFRSLWKTLGIDSVAINQLEFLEYSRPPSPSIEPAKKRAKTRDTSPKVTSIKNSQNSPLKNNAYASTKCPKCQAVINFHGREIKGNLMKFQMHMISHFSQSLFPEIPEESPAHYCPHEHCKAGSLKNRMSLMCHLSYTHDEFIPRIQRILQFPDKFKDVQALKDILKTAKTYPNLKKEGAEKVPNSHQLKDDMSLYQAIYNGMTANGSKKLQFPVKCNNCQLISQSQECIVLHQFIAHGLRFKHLQMVDLAKLRSTDGLLQCQTCAFVTFSKWSYLTHLGQDHNGFGEIAAQLMISISGNVDFQKLLGKNAIQNGGSDNANMDEISYSNSLGGVHYECVKCQASSRVFKYFLSHVRNKHKLPIMAKCSDCQKAQVHYTFNEQPFIKHRCFDDSDNVDQQPLESIATVYLPVDEDDSEETSTNVKNVSDEDDLDLIELE